MSLESLRADERYQALLAGVGGDKRNLSVANPALGSVLDRAERAMDAMGTLAVEHGWDPATRTWTDQPTP